MTTQKSFIPYIIIGAFALFIAFILHFVFRSMKSETHLVSANYYQQEIDYQTHIDKVKRSVDFQETTVFDVQQEQLVIALPKEITRAKGSVYFYNNMDPHLDVETPFEFSVNNPLSLNTSRLTSGIWTVKVDFESAGEHYYIEKKIVKN